MDTDRRSGILLHITSLPDTPGIGTMGKPAYDFADWLASAGQSLWQVLPLGPTGYGDSPYASFSTFAGNPLLIDLDMLAENGWAEPAAIVPPDTPGITLAMPITMPRTMSRMVFISYILLLSFS